MAGGQKDIMKEMVGQLEQMLNIKVMKTKIMQTQRAYDDTLENKIIPMYYEKNEKGYSDNWLRIMKNTIESNAGRFSTARMIKRLHRQIIYATLQFA